MVEDRRLQRDERRRRIETQVVGEDRAGAGERPQGVRLPIGPVQGDHELAGEPLAQRMLVERPLQLGGRLAMPAHRQQRVEAGLQRRQAQFLPAHGGRARPLLVGNVSHDRPAPFGEGRVERGQGLVGGAERASRGHAVLEPRGVEHVARHGQDITGAFAAQGLGVTERPSQQGDVALQRVDGGRRRIAGPDVVDESVDGDDVAEDQRQAGEHGPLSWPSERDRVAVALGRDRPQQPDVQRSLGRPRRWLLALDHGRELYGLAPVPPSRGAGVQ